MSEIGSLQDFSTRGHDKQLSSTKSIFTLFALLIIQAMPVDLQQNRNSDDPTYRAVRNHPDAILASAAGFRGGVAMLIDPSGVLIERINVPLPGGHQQSPRPTGHPDDAERC